ncbi:hypothetical protein PtA15_12A421 [Puccinia triticina]|uniref:Uncharacterized protein n=1 Tax=Puccinia triticina TaxID=208348 RepID=A0ABY7D678_9BASI|nr:uncharacterized protein PtA15_12A421 [Puccinia triticina]WAQ90432.1 hypothetical protein PtA15_12A421 [Puccinia triticina]WAR61749.1 hypothetical protein PtB15_12B439 [Puccinia triticina]
MSEADRSEGVKIPPAPARFSAHVNTDRITTFDRLITLQATITSLDQQAYHQPVASKCIVASLSTAHMCELMLA